MYEICKIVLLDALKIASIICTILYLDSYYLLKTAEIFHYGFGPEIYRYFPGFRGTYFLAGSWGFPLKDCKYSTSLRNESASA